MRRTQAVSLSLFLALISLALLVKAAVLQVPTGTWAPGGAMAQPRADSSAVLLQDGRVLITGGDGASGPLATAEFFNTDGSVSPAVPMNVARSGHISVVLQDGRVLVGGGTVAGGGATNAAEIYDPIANTWTSLAGGMMEARSGATEALLQDGRVAVAGGQNGSVVSSTIEIFDPLAGNFSFAGTLSSPRTQHAMGMLGDGRVMIIGGSNGTTAVASSDIYDPATRSIAPGPSLATPRSGHSATTLLDGRVLVAGGNHTVINADGTSTPTDLASAEIFDLSTGTFSAVASALATARQGHLAFLLPHNNNVLIVGGTSAGTAVASSEIFTPWQGTFSATSSLTTARSSAAGSPMQQDGLLLVAGGKDAATPPNALASTELYGFATVKTDKADYAPGTTVTITGSGWKPGETVTLSLVEVPPIDTHGPYYATADANGNILNTDFVTNAYDVNIRFYLTALGQTSGFQARTAFSDASTLSIKSGSTGFQITAPTGATDGTMNVSQAFTVQSIIHSSPGVSWTGVTVTLSVPSGWTKTANPAAFSLAANSDSSPITWTVTPPAAPSSGNLTVNVSGTPSSGGCSGPGSNTCADSRVLVVSAVNPAALSFGTVQAFDSSASPTDTIVTAGQQITVKVTVNNTGGAAANSVPAPTLATPTATGTAAASCGAGTPVSGSISGGGSRTYTYTCSSISGDGTLIFATSGQASGTDENSGLTLSTSGSAASNSVTVDSTAPTVSITGQPSNPTISTSATFTFTATDPTVGGVFSGVARVQCKLDAGAFANCATNTSQSYSALPEGSHTFQVQATDVAGNVSTATTFTWVVDLTPPTVTLTSTPPNPSPSSVSFSFTASDPTSNGVSSGVNRTECQLDGGSFAACTSPKTYNLTGGSHTFQVRAVDNAGNTGTAVTYTWKVDDQPPIVTLSFPAIVQGQNGWYNGHDTVPVIGTVTADDSTTGNSNITAISCGAFTVGSFSGIGTPHATAQVTVSAEGVNNVSCQATDSASNTGTYTGSTTMPVVIKIDTTSPGLTLGAASPAPNAAGWNNTNVSIPFTASDATSGVASTNPAASPLVLSTEGTAVTGTVTVTDVAGNSATFTSSAVKVDKTPPNPPTPSVSPSPNAAGWNNTNVTVTFNSNGDAGTVQSGIASCTSSISLTTETTGTVESGTCTDVAGNTSAPASVTVKIDKTPPNAPSVSISPNPNGAGWNNTNVTVTFTDNGDAGTAQSGIASCTSPISLTTETAGTLESGTCTDVAGNASTPASVTVKIDKTPPTLNFAAQSPTANANGWNNTNVSFGFTTADNLSGVSSTSVPTPLVLTTEGTAVTGTVTVTDVAGNSATFTAPAAMIDKTPPIASASATPGPNANGWNNTNVVVSFTGADSLSGIDFCAAPVTLSSEGANQSASGTCTDKAGNVSASASKSGPMRTAGTTPTSR